MYQAVDPLTVSHFVLYFVIAFFIRNNYLFAFLLGIWWEIIEYTITSNFSDLLERYWPIPRVYWEEKSIYNRGMDIVANMAGYTMGTIAYNRFFYSQELKTS